MCPPASPRSRQAERLAQATRNTRPEDSGGPTRRSLSPFSRRGQGALDTAGPAATTAAGAPEAGIAGRDRGPTLAIHRAGLGAHLLLPAVSVGAAWLLDLAIRFVENRVRYTAEHHILSGELAPWTYIQDRAAAEDGRTPVDFVFQGSVVPNFQSLF